LVLAAPFTQNTVLKAEESFGKGILKEGLDGGEGGGRHNR